MKVQIYQKDEIIKMDMDLELIPNADDFLVIDYRRLQITSRTFVYVDGKCTLVNLYSPGYEN